MATRMAAKGGKRLQPSTVLRTTRSDLPEGIVAISTISPPSLVQEKLIRGAELAVDALRRKAFSNPSSKPS
jgi:hypothetical protein